MTIEWNALATIAAPVVGLFVGVWVNRKFEGRPILISYFGHISAFRSTPPNGQPIHVHTHAVVLRNAGRRSATNVRLHHAVLPDADLRQDVHRRQRDELQPVRRPGNHAERGWKQTRLVAT